MHLSVNWPEVGPRGANAWTWSDAGDSHSLSHGCRVQHRAIGRSTPMSIRAPSEQHKVANGSLLCGYPQASTASELNSSSPRLLVYKIAIQDGKSFYIPIDLLEIDV